MYRNYYITNKYFQMKLAGLPPRTRITWASACGSPLNIHIKGSYKSIYVTMHHMYKGSFYGSGEDAHIYYKREWTAHLQNGYFRKTWNEPV